MTIEHLAWWIKASSQPTLKSKDAIRTTRFGDGYKQVSDVGLNGETLSYEFSFTGEPQTVRDICASLRHHKTKSFSPTPPGGDLALWRVETESLQCVTKSRTVETVSATFEQAFAPQA